MGEAAEEKQLAWTTWEELLLACAVERHGLKDWDTIATELQARSALPLLHLSAQACKAKFHDLKDRFMDDQNDDEQDGVAVPWLEELRKLRVAELKQEVHQYEISIQRLQLKVKRLQEERERSLKESGDDDVKPDLPEDSMVERSEGDKSESAGAAEEASPKVAASDGSDRENLSFNESNSSENGNVKRNSDSRELKPVREDSCNDNSGRIGKHVATKAKRSQAEKTGNSAELRDSVAESEGTKESSDVQSTASLARKRRREKEVSGGRRGGGGVPVASPAASKREPVRSQPLVELLDVIRLHKSSSVFEHRLESQNTDEYKKTVRQHMDLETIGTKIDGGSYSSDISKFYLDLLLLFNNAIVFFPKSSAESIAAHELRDLVLEEVKNNKKSTQKPTEPLPDSADHLKLKPDPGKPDTLLAKHKSLAPPIVICRKRSSVSAKASPGTNKPADKEKENNEKTASSTNASKEQSPAKMKNKHRIVTAKKKRPDLTAKNQTVQHSTNRRKASQVEKKRPDLTAKKRGAADFLKRINKSSPAKGSMLLDRLKTSPGSDGASINGRKKEQKKIASKRGGGKKQGQGESSTSKTVIGRAPAKRGRREVGGSSRNGRRKRGKEGGKEEVGLKRAKR